MNTSSQSPTASNTKQNDDHWAKALIRNPGHPHQFPSPGVTNFIIGIVLQSCLHYIDTMDQAVCSYVRYKRQLASSGELERGTRARRRQKREEERSSSSSSSAVDSKKPEGGPRRSTRLSTATAAAAETPPPTEQQQQKKYVELTVGDEKIVTDIEEPAPPTKEEEEMLMKMEEMAIEEDKKKEENNKTFKETHDEFPNVTDTKAANRFHSKFACLKTGGTTVKWPPWPKPWHKRLCELAKIRKLTSESLRNSNNEDDEDSQRLVPAIAYYFDGTNGARCEMTCIDPEMYKNCKDWTSDQWLAVLWSVFTKIIRLGNLASGGFVTDPSQKHLDSSNQFELGRAILEIGGPHSSPADTLHRLFALALYKFEEASASQFNEKGQPLLRLHISSRTAASPVEWRSFIYNLAELVETMPPALKAIPKDKNQQNQQDWRRFVVFMSSAMIRGLGSTLDHLACPFLRWSYFDFWRFIGPMNMPRHTRERLFVFAHSGIQVIHFDALLCDNGPMKSEVIAFNNRMQYYDQLLKVERETEIRHIIGLVLLARRNDMNTTTTNATKTSEVLNRVLGLINEYAYMNYTQRWPSIKSLSDEAKTYKVPLSRLLHEWQKDPFTVKFNSQFDPHNSKILEEVKRLNSQIERFNVAFLASNNIVIEQQPLKITDDPNAARPFTLKNTQTDEEIRLHNDFAETLMGGRTFDSQYHNETASPPQVSNPPSLLSSSAAAPTTAAASASSLSSSSSSMADG
jgi:hypothetical protein